MKENPKAKIQELEAEIERLRKVAPEPADLVGLTVASAELLPIVGRHQSDMVLRLSFTDGSVFDIRGDGDGDGETGVEIHFP